MKAADSILSVAIMVVLAVNLIALYLARWRISKLRKTVKRPSALPSPASLFVMDAFFWFWSDQHREVQDKTLTASVIWVRVCFVVLTVILIAKAVAP